MSEGMIFTLASLLIVILVTSSYWLGKIKGRRK